MRRSEGGGGIFLRDPFAGKHLGLGAAIHRKQEVADGLITAEDDEAAEAARACIGGLAFGEVGRGNKGFSRRHTISWTQGGCDGQGQVIITVTIFD